MNPLFCQYEQTRLNLGQMIVVPSWSIVSSLIFVLLLVVDDENAEMLLTDQHCQALLFSVPEHGR
jgi:hypothetical protein